MWTLAGLTLGFPPNGFICPSRLGVKHPCAGGQPSGRAEKTLLATFLCPINAWPNRTTKCVHTQYGVHRKAKPAGPTRSLKRPPKAKNRSVDSTACLLDRARRTNRRKETSPTTIKGSSTTPHGVTRTPFNGLDDVHSSMLSSIY